MGGINQIGKEVVTFDFFLKWVHDMISRLSLTLTCQSESLVAKILKSSMDKI